MQEKPIEGNFSRFQLFFLMSVYCLFEILLFYLVPFNLSYKYLKFTKEGIACIAVCLVPVFLCIYNIINYNKGRIVKAAVIILFFVIGVISPFLTIIYVPTISETYDIENYLKTDTLPRNEEVFINGFFPQKLPDNTEKVEYYYKFANEGMNKGVNISLLLKFKEEDPYLIFKKTLPDVQYGKSEEGFFYNISIDDLTYSIQFTVEN